jgi:signal transduction histidine kinase
LRLRVLGLALLVVTGTILLLSWYTLERFEDSSVFQLEHEALVLSDMLEAAIVPSLRGEPDVAAIQRHIDQIAATRDRNDIEINVMLRDGFRSSIVAGNIADNIGEISIYEHRDMMLALQSGEPIIFIGRDDDSPLEGPAPPSSPDHYIRPGERFISITTPLKIEGRELGGINTKLSLEPIDRHLAAMHRGIALMGIALPVVALILFYMALQRGLRPLRRLAVEVASVESSNLSHRFSSKAVPSELLPVIARLNELLERLDAAFHRERRFTANVAHELRTPIATLKVLTEVGRQEAAQRSNDPEWIAFFDDAFAVATQMERLVVNLLDLVRCESGVSEVSIAPVDLRSSIETAWKPFQPRAEARGIRSELTLGDGAVAPLDRTLLEAMLRNLFENAVAYTPEKGLIHCSLEKNGGDFIVTLANTSNGLTHEDLANLFEPFWRKEASRSDATHCGVGLSLVAAYARQLGVRLEAEISEPELFRITLRLPGG